MTTVGEILRQRREAKKLTIAEAEKATKIRAKFIIALEANEFEKLPPGTFAKGFIKNYASYLGLPALELLAFYRRQVEEEKPEVLPVRRTVNLSGKFSLTPSRLMAIAIGLLLTAFFSYLAFSYFKYAGSPTLLVDSPANNSVVRNERIEVVGKTDPEATLTINGQTVALNENGSFDVKITLAPGLNTLEIVASNKFKRQTIIKRNLRLER